MWKKLSLKQEAAARTYTACFSECCYHVVYGVHMDLLLHACASFIRCLYLWEARGFTSTSVLYLHKSHFVPFSVLFLCQVIFPWFYVFVVFMCVSVWLRCGVVWWGSPLFLSGSSRGWR